MARNKPLLEATMRQIIDHPELHYQAWYFKITECGTSACFAGWACMLSGWQAAPGHCYERRSLVKSGTGVIDHTVPRATVLLGLTRGEARILFAGHNTRQVLELMVKDLVDDRELQEWAYYHDLTA